MSRFLEPFEFAAACSGNGLKPEMEDSTGTLYVRRNTGGPRAAVAFGNQGLVDWSETCRRVLVVCFGHPKHGAGVCGA